MTDENFTKIEDDSSAPLKDMPFETIAYPAGSVIIEEGEESKRLYILLEGECVVSKHGIEITSFSQRGVLFGEMSMILDAPRTANVFAATDVKLFVLDDDLETVIEKYPEIAKVMLQTLANRLVLTTEALFSHVATLDLDKLHPVP